MASIKVAVRVRPFNDRERCEESEAVVEIQGKTVIVTDHRVPVGKDYDHRQRVHRFNFDYCYWSVDPTSSKCINQYQVYDELGKDILHATINGYNCCLFAYGQSGSGKTYSMMGNTKDPGLIPLLCQGMFESKTEAKRLTFITDISCMEIYNEKVYDLLSKRDDKNGLRVREHPIHGPYVDGLSRYVVQDVSSVIRLIEQIAENRNTPAAEETRKSKYHTIFTIRCCQILTDDDNLREVNSKLHLVDLAASERADLQFDSTRLKEGSNINKSLTTLGIVIASLAGRERRFAPYRDSVLTWLLKDSVGGNSFTFMLATVSPSSSSCSETISTLRYAQRVKKIINRPVINEAPTKRLLRQLKCEVNHLKEVFIQANSQERQMGSDACFHKSNGDSIAECQPDLEVEALLTVTRRSNLSVDGKMSDRNEASDDINSLLSPTFTGTLTSNYMVMLKDKISKQQQGNYIYRRLPFKVSAIDSNSRRRHSDTDLSPSNLSQNFAIFRAAFARKNRIGSANCHKEMDLQKSNTSITSEISVDSLKSCSKTDSTETLAKDEDVGFPSITNNSEESLRHIRPTENYSENEDVAKGNLTASELCYSLDSLAQCSTNENTDVIEEAIDKNREMSPSPSTDSITFVFLSKESAQSDSHSDPTDQNLSPRTLSVDSLFAEELLNQFRYNPSSSVPTNDLSSVSNQLIEENSEACSGFQNTSTQTIQKSKTQHSSRKDVPNDLFNHSNKSKDEVSPAKLVQLISDVVGLLKSGTAACKCKQIYSKSYLRHLVAFRKQMVDATSNKRPKYRVVSRDIYSCYSSESSMSGGFSSSSYLGTNKTEKCHRNSSHCDKRHGNIKAKWRSDSGAVCSGSDSSDAVHSSSDKSGAPLENNPCLPVPSPVMDNIIGSKNTSSDNINRETWDAVSFHQFEVPKRQLFALSRNGRYDNRVPKKLFIEADLFPDDDYLCLPHLLNSTNVKDVY